MKALLLKPFLALSLILFTVLTISSCKEKSECRATITVLEELRKTPVPNAVVTLYCDQNNCTILETATTGLGGDAEFVFENPVILNVKVTYDGIDYDGKYIKLLAGETVEEIVEIPR